jgi:hypothetical protein
VVSTGELTMSERDDVMVDEMSEDELDEGRDEDDVTKVSSEAEIDEPEMETTCVPLSEEDGGQFGLEEEEKGLISEVSGSEEDEAACEVLEDDWLTAVDEELDSTGVGCVNRSMNTVDVLPSLKPSLGVN